MLKLQVEQVLAEFIIANATAQGYGAPSKLVYRDRQERLSAITSSFKNRTTSSSLEVIGHHSISF